MMATAQRDRLHRLIDRLPDAELGAARRYLEYLDAAGSLPAPLARAAEEDDFVDPGEANALAEAEARLARSDLIPDSEFDAAVRRARQVGRSTR